MATFSTVAIVPLLPQLADRIHVTAFGSGVLLAAPNLTMFATSIPAGLLADRIGTRTVTRAGAMVLALGAVGQGLAHSFALLMAMRLVVGMASGVAWTTGLAWLAELRSGDDGDSRPLAATATSGGLGLVAGPALSAPLAGWLGPFTPLLILGMAAVPVMVAVLVVDRPLLKGDAGARRDAGRRAKPPGAGATGEFAILAGPSASEPDGRSGLGTGWLASARQERALVGGAVALMLSGLASGTANLLGPIELHAAGVSAQSIGLVFSVAAGMYIVASVFVVRFSARLITVSALGATLVAMTAALAPATLSVSVAAVTATLLAQAPLRAALTTISYPLSAAVGERTFGTGLAIGVLNGSWATAGVIGPTIAGTLAQLATPRLAFALLALGSLLCGALLARRPSPALAEV